ncbi:MAG TPA: hypothetical protein DD435_11105 [Cyanobacteria bacterium UBA8530]|nr:hypothetical protein [Cyanobacteria bacterium UBA8530]
MQVPIPAFARTILQKPAFWQFVRHVMSGFVAAFFDFTILWALVHYFNVNYQIAVALGFFAGSIVVYVLGALWVFERGKMSVMAEFMAVFGLNMIGLILSEIIITALVEFSHAPVLGAKCVSVLIVTFFNFYMRKKYVFTK